MKKIFLFEPSIGSENVGDQIIVNSIKKEMQDLLSPSFCIELATHTPLSNRYMYFLGKSDYKFILGSNIIVGNLTDVKTISILPPVGAVVLIIISIVLTLIAGLIPSRIASKKDPVEALRSE